VIIVCFFTIPFLDPLLSLTIFFVFSGSSSGILPLLQPQLRPWRAILQGHPTPPARATTIATPADSRRNATQPGTSLESISKEAGIVELEWEHQRKQLLEAIDGESCNLLNLYLYY
jgi:hypothetical protein